jgi:hypothetical protein
LKEKRDEREKIPEVYNEKRTTGQYHKVNERKKEKIYVFRMCHLYTISEREKTRRKYQILLNHTVADTMIGR